MTHMPLKAAEIARVQNFVLGERRKSLSEREWHFRLRGHGYGLRESGRNWVVTGLLENADLFEIDEAMLNAPLTARPTERLRGLLRADRGYLTSAKESKLRPSEHSAV